MQQFTNRKRQLRECLVSVHCGGKAGARLWFRRGRRPAHCGLDLACALALDVAGGGPFADDGGVAFEEVVHEGVEVFAEAHAGGEEFAEGVRASSRLFMLFLEGVEIAEA